MKAGSRRVEWVAPVLVGAAAAIAAEVAVGILLYAGPGLLRSLTTVLAVEGAAFAVGLRRVPSPHSELVDGLRRRWLFCLAAFVAAALFGTSWSVVQDMGGGPLGQGLGLALLAALPLYSCGLVLGGMGAVAATEPARSVRGPGAGAAMGAALGFVITGLLLPRAPMPASLLVGCLVMLSAGGMAFGTALGSRVVVALRAALRSAGCDVRVEDRLSSTPDEAARYLLEGGHVRRRMSLDGNEAVPWDTLVAQSLLQEREGASRILLVGGGASALPGAVSDERPQVSVDVLERNPAVLELAREHFDTRSGAELPERVQVKVGNLDDLLSEVQGTYDVVLVDTSALAPLGGVEGLSRAAKAALESAVEPDGVLVWGPAASAPSLSGWLRGRGVIELRRANGEEGEVLIVSPAGDAASSFVGIRDFTLADGEAS